MQEDKLLEEEIDRYLEGVMTTEENMDFNKRLKSDPDLAKEVELQRSIIRAIRNERLGKIIADQELKLQKQRNIRKFVISIGSLALAASLFGIIYLTFLNRCENLFNKYYVAYSYVPTPSRGEESPGLTKADSIFFDALLELERGNKEQAIALLENLHHSSYEMIAVTDSEISWYLSLAYLKNGQKKKARNLLLEIVKKPQSQYTKNAENLLKEL
jgi:DNA primase large subunit